MKIIHTSDWHIGHFFQNWDRKEEFRCFFEQLHHIIIKEKPDALIVAGDIFHNGNPAAESVAFYYQELKWNACSKSYLFMTTKASKCLFCPVLAAFQAKCEAM